MAKAKANSRALLHICTALLQFALKDKQRHTHTTKQLILVTSLESVLDKATLCSSFVSSCSAMYGTVGAHTSAIFYKKQTDISSLAFYISLTG